MQWVFVSSVVIFYKPSMWSLWECRTVTNWVHGFRALKVYFDDDGDDEGDELPCGLVTCFRLMLPFHLQLDISQTPSFLSREKRLTGQDAEMGSRICTCSLGQCANPQIFLAEPRGYCCILRI